LNRALTCIVCPTGCEIEATVGNGDIVLITGDGCKRGAEYIRQELIDPRRTISSSVLVKHGELPLVSVRLNRAVPKKELFRIMQAIAQAEVEAPVTIGDCVIPNVLELCSDVIVTKNIARK
jgi:CxxC motif-containing protein